MMAQRLLDSKACGLRFSHWPRIVMRLIHRSHHQVQVKYKADRHSPRIQALAILARVVLVNLAKAVNFKANNKIKIPISSM